MAKTILLAEDDDAIRNLSLRVLRREGYVVLEAESANDAIAISAQHAGDIDLVLSDVVMPHMSGRTLAERISATRPSIRVLFMSGYTPDDMLELGVSAGALNFLPKPFTPDQLAKRVRELLAG